MTSSRDRRVAKELADIQADRDNSGVYAALNDGVSMRKLTGTFPGPPGSPYAGGTFEVDIEIPDNYPFHSPNMRLKTKIWHPNISSQTGAICLDTLSSGWSPVQTIKTALLSLRMLLEMPNPKDPQDAEVAKMLVNERSRFTQVAQEWSIKYAGAPRQQIELSEFFRDGEAPAQEDDEKRYRGYNRDLVERFVSMGFAADDVIEAFIFFNIDRNNGQDYVLEEAYMGDITARLLGEQ